MTNNYMPDMRADGLFNPLPSKSYRPKNDDARTSVLAFLDVAGARIDNTCYLEVKDEGSAVRVYGITHAGTNATAKLAINYGGAQGYHAKILVKKGDDEQQLPITDLETTIRKLGRFLDEGKDVGGAKKKGTTRRARRASGAFDVHAGTMTMRDQHRCEDADVEAMLHEEDF